MVDLTLRCRLLISIGLLLFLGFSCRPVAEGLPAKSHHGNNTLGYIIESGRVIGGSIRSNDIIYKSNESLNFSLEESYRINSLQMEHHLRLFFGIDSITNHFFFENAVYIENGQDFVLDNDFPNFVSIDFQTESQRIVAGTFELNFAHYQHVFVNDSTFGIQKIQEQKLTFGRFDVRY